MEEIENDAKKLTHDILKGMGQQMNPLSPIIEASIHKALLESYQKGLKYGQDLFTKTFKQ